MSRRVPRAIIVVLPLLLPGLIGCGDGAAREAAMAMTGGVIGRGENAIRHHGCASCHIIPGIRGADGLVGPPLDRLASRSYIGGVVSNTPENLIRWIQDPPSINPGTAMPNLGIGEAEARDIASYLYTLR